MSDEELGCKISASGSVDLVMRSMTSLPQLNESQRRRIKSFDLTENKFNGATLSIFAEFRNLHTLNLSSNSMDAEKLAFFRMPPHLEILNLADNKIDSLSFKGPISSLRELNVSRNRLKDPDKIHFVFDHLGSSLEQLDLSYNQLESLPQSVRKLWKLKSILLQGNPFVNFPPVLASLPAVEEMKLTINGDLLELDSYDMEDSLQYEIMKFCREKPDDDGKLDWGYSRGHLKSLLERLEKSWNPGDTLARKIMINSSMLSDDDMKALEVAFRRIKALAEPTILSLCTNKFTKVPRYIEKFLSLEQVGLCRNKLKEVPAELRRLPRLKLVYITDNEIEDLHFLSHDFPALNSIDLKGNPICKMRDNIMSCFREWRKYRNGDRKVIKGLEWPSVEEEEVEPSSVKPTVATGATAAPVRQRGIVQKTGLMEMERYYEEPSAVPVEIPKEIAAKSIVKLQTNSITKLKHHLEDNDALVTWKNLVSEFFDRMPMIDQAYITSLGQKWQRDPEFSPAERFISDLASAGITVRELIRGLVNIRHILAAGDVCEIETDYIQRAYDQHEDF